MKILCIDDKNWPDAIPTSVRVVEGQEYEPYEITRHVNPQTGEFMYYGVRLLDFHPDIEEVTNGLYSAYKMDRFAIHEDDMEAFIELLKASTANDNVDWFEERKNVPTYNISLN